MILINQRNNNSNKNDFWIGFSDLMSGLMLVFIVLAITFMIISLEDKKKVEISKEKIEKLLIQSEEDRKKVEELIRQAKKDKDEIEKRKKSVIVVLSNQLALNNIKVEYDSEKGTVTIAQDILFAKKKSNLKEEGRVFIKLFASILDKNIFNDNEYKELIKYIHIEGYASNEGGLEYNFALSFSRAKNVWLYMTEGELINKNIMKQKLNIVSRGEIEANQSFVDISDRKVIFRFEFYDTYTKIFEGLSK